MVRSSQASPPDAEITRLGKEIFKIQADNIYVIGVVGNIQQAVAVKSNLRNFPKNGGWANTTSLAEYGWPFQWYFEGASRLAPEAERGRQ